MAQKALEFWIWGVLVDVWQDPSDLTVSDQVSIEEKSTQKILLTVVNLREQFGIAAPGTESVLQ
jgi:hypothetical protein